MWLTWVEKSLHSFWVCFRQWHLLCNHFLNTMSEFCGYHYHLLLHKIFHRNFPLILQKQLRIVLSGFIALHAFITVTLIKKKKKGGPALFPHLLRSYWLNPLRAQLLQSFLILYDSMDCNPSVSVHGNLQARILEWIAMPSYRGFSCPRDLTCMSCLLHCKQVFTASTTWEAQNKSTGICQFLSVDLYTLFQIISKRLQYSCCCHHISNDDDIKILNNT